MLLELTGLFAEVRFDGGKDFGEAISLANLLGSVQQSEK